MTNRSRLFACLIFLCCCALGATADAGEASVPDTVGLSLDKARTMLEEAGFSVAVTPAPGRPIGVVFSQKPGGLCTRTTGSTVTLVVGGPTPKPGVGIDRRPTEPTEPTKPKPKPADDAPPAGSGPVSGPADDLGAPPAGAGAVPVDPGANPLPTRPAPTQPRAGAASGSTSLVYQGRAIPPGSLPSGAGPELPSVLNMSSGQAQRALRRWTVKVEQTLSVPALVGKVVNQVPFASSRLATSETVTIIVAIAKASPDQRFVQQAQGKRWLEAAADLEAMGLLADPRSVPSSAADRGKVIMQSPQAGSLAMNGSAVTLLVGRGPGAYSAEVDPSLRPTEPRGEEPTKTDPTPTEPEPSDPVPTRMPTRMPTPMPTPMPTEDGPPAGAGDAPIEPGTDLPPSDQPPAGMPPTDMPPTDTPPADTPPADAPPADKPPTDTPPADAPPADAPPADEPPVDEPEAKASLAAPTLKGPPAGESYPYKYGADFSWTPIKEASGYEFELQEEEQATGTWKPVGTVVVSGPSHRPAKVKRGRYRWRVRAMRGEDPGTWSDYRRLYMY